MMPAPGFNSSFPLVRGAPSNVGSFVSQPSAGYASSPPSPPKYSSVAQQQTPAPRVVRGQRPDEPAPEPAAPIVRASVLRMPSPQELGVGDAKRPENPSVDWAAVHSQLDRLGATCFQLERTLEGSLRITCLLPTEERGRSHRIEAQASSEAEAVRLALARAQEWKAGR